MGSFQLATQVEGGRWLCLTDATGALPRIFSCFEKKTRWQHNNTTTTYTWWENNEEMNLCTRKRGGGSKKQKRPKNL
jgi:hypothetical protein